VPIVTHATGSVDPVRSPSADPASRVRRLIGSAREDLGAPGERGGGGGSGGQRLLEAALSRFDAPVNLRIRGGAGSGRRTLASALRARRGWHPVVDDLDVVAAPGAEPGPPPDIEIVCLRTAPCRHEESWLRRARAHALLVVATGVDGSDPPHWAAGLHALDARHPDHRSVDGVVAFLDRALETLPAVRVTRLEAELEMLAVHDEVGDLAEAALCALGGTAGS